MLTEKEFLSVFKDSLHIEEPKIDDNDWFFDSIAKYEHLLMYDLAFVTENVEFSSSSSICIANSSRDLVGNKEILQLSVPQKLTASCNGKDEGLCKDRDFEIVSGALTVSPIGKLACSTSGASVLATTLRNFPEAILYKIGDKSDGEIAEVQRLNLPWSNPSLAVSQTGRRLALAQTANHIEFHDLDHVSLPNLSTKSCTSESREEFPLGYLQFVEDSVFMCEQNTGRLFTWDSRTESSVLLVNSPNCVDRNWTAAAATNLHLIARLSSEGEVDLFDTRRCPKSQSLDSFKVSFESPNLESDFKSLVIRFSPDSKCISVSGLDNLVYVYRIGEFTAGSCFIHEGHSKSHLNPLGITTTHQWHPSLDNLVISASSNHSLHAWQFGA